MGLVTFKNTHGLFELKVGETYDLDLVDGETGDVYPYSRVKIRGQNEESLIVVDTNKKNQTILKGIIAHVEVSGV